MLCLTRDKLMRKLILRKTILVLSIFLIAFCFSVLNTNIFALAVTSNVTTNEELYNLLENLKNGKINKNTNVIIDGSEVIDYSGISHTPINLSNTEYAGKNISITFNTSVTNVYHKTLKEFIHNTEHYGLFSNTLTGYVNIYYKVNLDPKDGVIENNLSYYKYGTETTLPTVTAPNGKTFIKWIEVGDETQTAVTNISQYDWGIKNFIAVYEEDEIFDDENISPIPSTYEIIYNDAVNNIDTSLLDNIYTQGGELVLPTLEKEGFTFIGWSTSDNNVIDILPTTIPNDYISNDNKIYLNAVWELESMISVSLNGINKTYDGCESVVIPEVNHPIIDKLALSYTWYIASTEEEKSSPKIFSYDDKLSFVNHVSSFFKVRVDATHTSSGLKTSTYDSDWVKVNIDKIIIKPRKISNPTIIKTYDGSRAVNYTFTINTDYVLDGTLENEEIDALIYSSYDSANVDATSVTLLFDSLIFGKDVVSENYSFVSCELYFSANITPRIINLGNETFSKIYGDEDNLPNEIATGIGQEKIGVLYSRNTGETVGKYAINNVEMVPNNANYILNFIGSSFLTIEKRTPELIFPTFKNVDYNPSNTLLSLELESEDIVFDDSIYKNSLGEFSWENNTLIPFVNFTEGYSLIFTPYDIINYDYSSLDGYNEDTHTITRKIILNVSPIDPISIDIDNRMEIAIGRRFSSIELPTGFSINEDVVSLSSIVYGNVGENQTLTNAIVYDHDGTPNYNKLYKDLIIDFVYPEVIYHYNGQSKNSVNQTEVIINPNNDVSINFELENPFDKAGYNLSSWNINGAIVTPNAEINVGSIYELNEMTKNKIDIVITLKARDDIKVTFCHYYENLELAFNSEYDLRIERNDCTADDSYMLSTIDILEKDGFDFAYATLNTSNESIENFAVSPYGDSVINLYYTRKNVSVSFVDTSYSSLNPIGSLPSEKIVKFGIPFSLDSPSAYTIQGYIFVGYTDGITYYGEELKLFTEENYVVNNYVESITFSVVYRPINTLIIDENLGIENLTAIIGEKVILPNKPLLAPEGKRFAGWVINGATYEEGAEFIMPNGNVKLEILWEDVPSRDEDSLGAIIGASVGSFAGLAVIITLTVIFVKKSKRKARIEPIVNNDNINEITY